MESVDPAFLALSRAALASANRGTLADVKRLAEVDEQLTATQRRDLLSALNRLEHLFQTPLVQLEASPRRCASCLRPRARPSWTCPRRLSPTSAPSSFRLWSAARPPPYR